MTAGSEQFLRRRLRIVIGVLYLAIGLVSLVVGDRLAREWLFETQVSQLETLRAEGGQYVVNDFLSGAYQSDSETAVLYGDSANDSMPRSDSDRRFISQMLEDALAGDPISSFGVSFPGNSPAWITSHLRFLNQRFPDLDYAVIPINLRWISPGWRGIRDTNNSRSAYELYGLGPFRWILGIRLPYESPRDFDPAKRPIETVLGAYDASVPTLTDDQYMERFGGDSENARQQIRWHRIVLSYGFKLANEDPLFRLVERIGEDCAATGLRCLFYLPPFNLDYIEQTETTVAQALRGNVAAVRDFARARGLTLLDLSSNLPTERFHDLVNEHVDQVGRQLVSGCIAATLRAWQQTGEPEGKVLTCDGSSEQGFVMRPTSAPD